MAVVELADPELDAWWAARAPGLVRGVCHGDYYRHNLLVDHDEIRGIIDWHEARLGPLIGEVAFAAWEFGPRSRGFIHETMDRSDRALRR